MREMKDSDIEWIGKIPKDWGICRIAHHTNFVNGYAFQSGDLNNDNGCIVIRIGNVSSKGLNLDNALKYNGNITELLGYKIKNGDIVIAMSGATTGKNCLVRSCKEVLLINQRVGIVRANKDIRFISYILNCTGFSNYIDLLSAGSAQPNISGKSILSFRIPDPPIDTQQRIADYLDSKCSKIDAIIEREQAVIEKLKEYKLSVITEAVTKGLNPNVEMKDSGIEWIGEIPATWGLNKIGTLYEERNIKVSDRDYKALSVTKQGIVPQLEHAAKTDNGDNRKLIKVNDFVINSRSDRRGSCGISEYDGSCSLINTVLKPRKNMCNAYYSFVFRSEVFSDEFYRWGNGIVDDLWSTRWSSMKNIYIPFPTIDEQHRIADFLNSKCSKIDAITEHRSDVLGKLNEYKKSLIYEVVTGKKEV